MATIYGDWCPLCGKPAVQDMKCLACGYAIGSDSEIDSDPVPHGGYPDWMLEEAKLQQNRDKKRKIMAVLPGLGILLFVVGLIIGANGGGNTVGAIGLVIMIVCFFVYWRMVARMSARAWYNRQKYRAYGDEPDWRKDRRQ